MFSLEKNVLFKSRLGRTAAIGALFALAASPAHARPKTDVIILINGDHVTGEIKKLERGKLTVLTDPMGTVEIEWEKIEKVTSQYRYTVALRSA